jgi:hypothetical protein
MMKQIVLAVLCTSSLAACGGARYSAWLKVPGSSSTYDALEGGAAKLGYAAKRMDETTLAVLPKRGGMVTFLGGSDKVLAGCDKKLDEPACKEEVKKLLDASGLTAPDFVMEKD